MLALVARRLKLSYNVLNLRNFHCRPSEQCQTFNHNNDESHNSKSVVSKHFGGLCKWSLRGQNPDINFDGSDQYTKIVSQTLNDQCWWKSKISRHFSLLPQKSNNVGKDETKTVVLSSIGGECDWKSSDPYSTKCQCILKRYGKQKKRKHCNCEYLNYQWSFLKWVSKVSQIHS